jgi:nucleoside-diphosphate-sugar epimerase
VARALIVGCGCRGRELGAELLARGWAVRGTSRREEGLAAIEAVGIEAVDADPARPGTVLDLVGDVTALVWLLGSAVGTEEELANLHGASLERVLERLVETPVRRFVYEAGGSLDDGLLKGGTEIVDAAAERWRIPAVTPKKVTLSDIAKLG